MAAAVAAPGLPAFPERTRLRPAVHRRELARHVAHRFDAPAGNRIQRRRAKGLAGAEAETGMMPRASDGVADEQALFERSTVVRADCADREHLVAAPGEEHGLALGVPEQHGSIRDG